ncbi:MAG TPA: SusC/RagA family TonB-linked outer membrane protein [Ohtaekwangia sp.]|uniref:SusC/RagA family TonB-linked outer membrane protein n=1 Tax=Ohtaekwangia sp. TaxID=2066019 RepID=UPI002F9558A7
MNESLQQRVRSLGTRSRRSLLTVAAWILAVCAYAQTSVTGRVTSGEDASPLPGVNILVKGTAIGTITDADGRYSISVPTADATLVFSFVGYISQEVALAGRTSADIVLASDATQLSEVVVTALGVEKDVAKLGYSQQKVNGSELVKAREPNAMNSLVGKVAGLTVGASSEMLGRPQLVLRGETNLLIVVDGVPVVSDTWNISPDDIESYTVLKGPAAAALYGSRGQNGAIMITTKKGTSDKRGFAIDFNSSTMVDKGFLTIPKVQNEYGPGEYNTYRFGDDDFGQKNGYNQNDYDVWGPKFNGQLISQYDSPFDPATGVRAATPWVARGKDNLQRFLRAGILSTNNIAIASSTDKYDIRASVSHTYQRGIVPNTDLNIDNFNVSTGYNFSKRLRIESNINYNRQYTDNIPDVNYGPNSLIYNIDVWAGADWDINALKNYWQPGKEGVQQRNFEYIRYNNPWFVAHEWLRGHHKTDIYGYVALKYDLTDWLKASIRTQITSWDLTRTEKFPFSASAYGRDQKQGDYREDKRALFENNTDVLLNFNKDITPSFNVSGLVGGNLRTYNFNSSYITTDYLNVPGVYNFANSKNPVKAYNYTAPMQVGSGYYSLDLSYGHYVTVSTTGRYDKFSNLPSGYNSGFYPSFGLSTVISDYVNLPEVFSFLKFRTSYANVKNTNTQSTIGPAWMASGLSNPLGYGDTYQSAYDGPIIVEPLYYNTGRPYNNVPAVYINSIVGSKTLKVSSNSSYELGMDLKMLENRIGVGVTYFDAIKGPGIATDPWSSASGYLGGLVNAVKTEKKGWEVALNATPLKLDNGFTWNVAANWSTYVERYKEFYNGLNQINGGYINADSRITYKVGDRVDGNYGYKFYRDKEGNIIHKANGDPYKDNLVAQKLGNYNPDWVWSVVNTVSYKNFTLNFQFDGRVGGVGQDYVYKKLLQGGRDISTVQGAYGAARLAEFNANPNDIKYNDNLQPLPTYVGQGVALAADSPDPDVDPNTGKIKNLDQLKLVPNTTAYSLQDYIGTETKFDERVLISKTFTKLRQVTLTYNIPSSIMQRTAFRAASVSFVGRNLLYFAKRKDIDWDSFIGTYTAAQDLRSPTLRRYGININLTF